MKRLGALALALAFTAGTCGALFAADTLETIKKKGVRNIQDYGRQIE